MAKVIGKLSPAELAARAQELRRLDKLREQTATKECEIIAEMGKILIDTKKRIGHGKWESWVKANLTFTPKTAGNYMRLAANRKAISDFLPLGKCVVYQILELDEKTRARLTMDTKLKVGGRTIRLRDLECCDAHEALGALRGRRYGRPSDLARGMSYVGALKKLRETNAAAWAELADDIAALLSVATPSSAVTVRTNGETRDERGRNMLAQLEAIIRIVDEVDDVGGKLSATIKAAALPLAQRLWRAINRLPAWATPQKTARARA